MPHLVLSTPAASRVFRTRSGAPAVHQQSFHVEDDGLLEWIPEPFIPHAGASYVQSTTIDLHPQANLLFFEWLAPGRVAMGEIFGYKQLHWKPDLRVGGELIARERYTLQPENHSLEVLQARKRSTEHLSHFCHSSGISGKNVWYLGRGLWLLCYDCVLDFDGLGGGGTRVDPVCR